MLDEGARNRRRWRGRQSSRDSAPRQRNRKIGKPDAARPAAATTRRRPCNGHSPASRVRGRTGSTASTIGVRSPRAWSDVWPAYLSQRANSGLGLLAWLIASLVLTLLLNAMF